MRGRTGVGAAALLCAVALGGCTADAGVQPTPSPTPSVATPTESAEERQERLDYAAAEKAYRTFRAEFGRVMRAGGAKQPTARMRATAAGPYLKEFTEIIRAYEGLGLRTTGKERIRYVRPAGHGPQELNLEVCEDSSGLMEVDIDGKVVPAGEIRIASIQVRATKSGWKLWSGEGRKVASCD